MSNNGTATCMCSSGYTTTDSGVTCVDIDECATSNGGCGIALRYSCLNNPGAAPTCGDADECATNNGACGDPLYYLCTNNIATDPTCGDRLTCATNNGGCDTTPMATCGEVVFGPNTCTCPSGYNTTDNGVTCNDIDDCVTNNGGCYRLTPCINNPGAPRTCSPCPAGYFGTGLTNCAPSLTALAVSSGSLSPSLTDLSVTSYAVTVGLATQAITFTPTVPSGATVLINGNVVPTNGNWQGALPTLTTVFTVLVTNFSDPDRTYTVSVRRGYQEAYIKASNTGGGDNFGWAIALSGDTLVIGAPNEDSGAPSSQADNSAADRGAVYVFVRSGNTWAQQAYLKANFGEAGDSFGRVVAISGNTIAVGAHAEDSNATGVNGNATDNSASNSGAAYVFVRTGTTWLQQAYLKASNAEAGDQFGVSVAVNIDTIVVGADNEDSNAVGLNGLASNNAASNSGAAYIFTRSGGTWSQQAYVKASNTDPNDYFGSRVAVDGDTVLIGAYGEDGPDSGINPPNQGNHSAADLLGAAYIFVRAGTTWSQEAYVKASNTNGQQCFGSNVAISGDTAIVAAWNEGSGGIGVNGSQTYASNTASGAVYVFVRSGTTWTQQAYVKASNPDSGNRFGHAIGISADTFVVGAIYEDSNTTGINGAQNNNASLGSGAAYVFSRSGTTWSQLVYLKASNTGVDDNFGGWVAIDADTIVVSAWLEDSMATGINGNQGDNSAADSGAVYVIR
jgi:hypothetical protein